ncbi:MAG: LuxR C-terminal-related transcriptional regulator [Treponema sp.]|nr:LuxR C-terminal-related transcriptional regulator [Treponema sp.]
MITRYVCWSHGNYLSLRSGEKEIRESLEAVLSGRRAVPQSLWESVDEYSRLPDFEPYLTRREIEIVRYIAEGRTAWEAAEVLTISEHTELTIYATSTGNSGYGTGLKSSNWRYRRGFTGG